MGAVALMVMLVETLPSGIPTNSSSMSASEPMETPTFPTSPAASGVLPHGPELAQVHVAVDAARVGILARRRRDLLDVVRPVEGLDLDPAPGGAHGRNSRLRMASSRVISSTTSPFWFLPRKRNFTTPAWPGLPKAERRGSSSVFASTVLSANSVSPANTGVRW